MEWECHSLEDVDIDDCGEGVPFSRLSGKPMPLRDCLTLDIEVIDMEYRQICSILWAEAAIS